MPLAWPDLPGFVLKSGMPKSVFHAYQFSVCGAVAQGTRSAGTGDEERQSIRPAGFALTRQEKRRGRGDASE